MDAEARVELIRDLCSFERRVAGSDAERRAANWLAATLRARGRRVEVEATYVHPQAMLVQAAHCALGFAGSIASIASPPVGFAVVLAAATSMYLDLNARSYLLRLLFFRRASQNVVSPGRRDGAPARLIISAHYDAGRAGWLFRPRRIRLGERIGRVLGVPFSLPRGAFWSLALLLPILGARLAGADTATLSLLQLIPTLLLLGGAAALAATQLGEVVPAANDNASGVAAALALAEELDADPPRNLDVWVVLSGGGECVAEGMRAFVRAHREDLDPATTFFLNIDAVGAGELRYVASEGLAVGFEMDRRVLELCEAIAAAGPEHDEATRPKPLASALATDALPLRLARYPGTTITATAPDSSVPVNYHLTSDRPDAIDPAALEWAGVFGRALVRQLDREAARRTSPPGGVPEDGAPAADRAPRRRRRPGRARATR